MHRPEPLRRVWRALAPACVAATLAGCALGDGLLQRVAPEDEPPRVALHLAELTELLSAPEAEQRRLIGAMERDWAYNGSADAGLRLALALATPGHTGYAPERAGPMLDMLLADENALAIGEVRLLELRRVELRNRVQAARAASDAKLEDAHRTASQLHETHAELEQALQRASELEARNQELTEALHDAENKLEAITTIERTIRERDDGNDAD